MADNHDKVDPAGCDERQSSEPMAGGSSGPIVGDDSQRVIDDSTDDKVGILSHEGTDAADRPGQGDSVGRSLPGGVEEAEKAPNKADLESEQSLDSQELKSEMAGAEGRKQSQSSQGNEEKAEVERWPTGSEEWLVPARREWPGKPKGGR
jgi:hypothetical protein